MPKVRIQYFALLREQRGTSDETIESAATTVGALYDELRGRYRFSLPRERIRAAINGDFAPADAPLHDGDHVVFIPPVAGG